MILNPHKIVRCHSGGAEGADSYFEEIGSKYGIQTIAYSYKTHYHNSPNKYEISEEEFEEGCLAVFKANETLKKYRLKPYLNLYSRNWFQVKNAEQIFAISSFIQIENQQLVKGGTGITVQMAIDIKKEVFVFEQRWNAWFYWDYSQSIFIPMNENPKITSSDFAGIGARKINSNGINAIENLMKNSFKPFQNIV
jgi:hypothetical protein